MIEKNKKLFRLYSIKRDIKKKSLTNDFKLLYISIITFFYNFYSYCAHIHIRTYIFIYIRACAY